MTGEHAKYKSADILILGAGAAGCAAALTAESLGMHSVLLEKNDRVCRKILVTGNGRCNLSNTVLSEADYHAGRPELVRAVFKVCPQRDVYQFLRACGILTHARNGFVYPRTDQAATVAAAMELSLERACVPVRTKEEAVRIERYTGTAGDAGGKDAPRFLVHTAGGRAIPARNILIACGGPAGPSAGGTEAGLKLSVSLGQPVTALLPSLVPLCTADRSLKPAAGVRTQAAVTLLVDGKPTATETGELQITKDTISGMPVFQLSGAAAAALAAGSGVSVSIDFLPELPEDAYQEELAIRRKSADDLTIGSFLLGLVPDRIASCAAALCGTAAEAKLRNLKPGVLEAVCRVLRAFPVSVSGTGSFAAAQVTRGGVDLSGVKDTLESARIPGLWFAGEVLDVDGRCGGYNLTFAFASGIAAVRNMAVPK